MLGMDGMGGIGLIWLNIGIGGGGQNGESIGAG